MGVDGPDLRLDGQTIPNPLRSFVFPVTITDNVSTDDSLYTKPKGYETVRVPFSGLVGTADAKKKLGPAQQPVDLRPGRGAAEPEHRELVDAADG